MSAEGPGAEGSGPSVDDLPVWTKQKPIAGYELRYCAEYGEVVVRDIASGRFVQVPEATVRRNLATAYEMLRRAEALGRHTPRAMGAL